MLPGGQKNVVKCIRNFQFVNVMVSQNVALKLHLFFFIRILV